MSTLEEARAKIRERPPFEIQNLHLLKEKRSGATFATAYMNARDPNYLKGSFRPQNLHLLTTKRAEATFGRTVLAHAEHFALEDGGDAADDGPPDAEALLGNS